MIGTKREKLPITALIAVKNEAINIERCLKSLIFVERVVVIDSGSIDNTCAIAQDLGAEIVQFVYQGGYPKKRQWALDNIKINTPWVLLLDADEMVPEPLWNEIRCEIKKTTPPDAFLITKGFHFFGKKIKKGGFSHSAVLLIKNGKARFEKLFDDLTDGLDMEIHERVIVDGDIGKLNTPLVHEDFKGLEAYIEKHNKYSTWEAKLRYLYIKSGRYGVDTIQPRFSGNFQEKRRYLKKLIIRLPLEHWVWFIWHYVIRLGFMEGRPGLIASQIRAHYILQVNMKLYEMMNKKV